jgi:hypothetical protein
MNLMVLDGKPVWDFAFEVQPAPKTDKAMTEKVCLLLILGTVK